MKNEHVVIGGALLLLLFLSKKKKPVGYTGNVGIEYLVAPFVNPEGNVFGVGISVQDGDETTEWMILEVAFDSDDVVELTEEGYTFSLFDGGENFHLVASNSSGTVVEEKIFDPSGVEVF